MTAYKKLNHRHQENGEKPKKQHLKDTRFYGAFRVSVWEKAAGRPAGAEACIDLQATNPFLLSYSGPPERGPQNVRRKRTNT